MLPEALLRLHVLVLNVGRCSCHEYILNTIEGLGALALTCFAHKLLHLVCSVDALLSLILAMIHLEEQVCEP